MRNIKYIAVHCTAGWQTQGVKELQAEFKAKGWRNAGYHFVVLANGKIEQLVDEQGISNGVYGYNSVSINVAYTGGIAKENGKIVAVDNRTEAQKVSLRGLIKMLKKKYPNAIVQGHRDFSPDRNKDGKITPDEWIKACPCFDAKEEYKDL